MGVQVRGRGGVLWGHGAGSIPRTLLVRKACSGRLDDATKSLAWDVRCAMCDVRCRPWECQQGSSS